MKQNVYAIHDVSAFALYQFAALETVLAKDAVLAFIEEQHEALFGVGAYGIEDKETLQVAVSKTNSVEELTAVLNEWDFAFNVIQIS